MPLVYHVITDKNVGGAGRVLLSLLREAKDEHFPARVFLPRGSALSPLLVQNGILFTELNGMTESSFSFSSFAAFLRLLRKAPCDLLVCHGCIDARLAGRLCGVPLLLSFKHCDVGIPHGKAVFYDRLTDATLAVSENARQTLLRSGISEKKIFLLENGAALFVPPTDAQRRHAREKLGIGAGDIAVGLCGRLCAVKGHETAMRALRLLPDRFSLWFLGEGENAAALAALSRTLGIAERVHFLGFSPDVRDFYYAMDAHLSCSLASETASLSLAEGMRAGCATFASDIPGNRARVKEGGRFFPPGDSAALAALLGRLADGSFCEVCRKAARIRAMEIPSEQESGEAFRAILKRLWANRVSR